MRRTAMLLLALTTGSGLAAGEVVTAAGASGPAAEALAEKKPLKKKQFIKRADAICTRYIEAFQGLYDDYFGDLTPGERPTDAEVDAYVADLVVLIDEELDELEDLRPPKKDQRKVRRIFAATREANDTLAANPQPDTNAPFEEASRLGRAYGFKVCSGEEPAGGTE